MLPTYKQTLKDYFFQISSSQLLQFVLSRNVIFLKNIPKQYFYKLNSEALLEDTLTSEWLDFLIKTCHFHKTLPQFPKKFCMFIFPCLQRPRALSFWIYQLVIKPCFRLLYVDSRSEISFAPKPCISINQLQITALHNEFMN